MSDIQENLKSDLKEAMKVGDDTRVSVIRDLMTELTKEDKESDEELSEDEIMQVIKSKAKQRRDSIESFKEGGRDDLVKQEKEELEIIEEYLPEQLSDDELEELVEDIIDEVGATGMQDMGSVMGRAMDEVGARAEGERVKDIVKSKLS